ncbi:MAG: DUF120 domain-containing protein [Candidatus Aenigmarchaeota archaeon]|nr:DUF120 domain-containing protein [Candidatus Aenigmarchaeota archaeon]
MRYDDIEIISLILRLKKDIISTGEFAPALGLSQQSVSRKIRELESNGLIKKEITARGQKITVLAKGLSLLRTTLNELNEAVGSIKKNLMFKGFVVSGLGEGSYYLGQDKYFVQFLDKLGFSPFKGTLNLRIKEDSNLDAKEAVISKVPIIINGFSDSGRTFGDIMCFRCKINNEVEGAIIVPKRTHHDDRIVEIIAPVCLRESMTLVDGDEVEVTSY